jgi:hypothetical protein
MRFSRLSVVFVMLGLIVAGRVQAAPAVVLEGARLIDGTGKPARENAALVIEGDRITEVRDQQRQGSVPGASLFTAGRGIGVANGTPPQPVAPDQSYRPATVEEARAAVREMAGHKVDIVKIWVDDNFGKFTKMPPEMYKAVIDECHRHKLRVASHVFYLADAKALVAAGVDVLAHSVRDLQVDAERDLTQRTRGPCQVARFATSPLGGTPRSVDRNGRGHDACFGSRAGGSP